MKKLITALAAAALLGVVGQASAADLAARPMYTKAPMAPPVYNWTGAYIGINGGGGWGEFGGLDVSGGFVGGTLGYNWQQGQAVFGLETDIAWSGIDGNSSVLGVPFSAGSDWFGTVRGRLGFAQDRALWFVAGGLAYGNLNVSTPFGSADDTNAGWTLGGGVEVALQGPWTAKIEYLHIDLGDLTVAGVGTGASFDADLVRAGLNYRF